METGNEEKECCFGEEEDGIDDEEEEEEDSLKKKIASHALYGLLVDTHIDCLKVFLSLSLSCRVEMMAWSDMMFYIYPWISHLQLCLGMADHQIEEKSKYEPKAGDCQIISSRKSDQLELDNFMVRDMCIHILSLSLSLSFNKVKSIIVRFIQPKQPLINCNYISKCCIYLAYIYHNSSHVLEYPTQLYLLSLFIRVVVDQTIHPHQRLHFYFKSFQAN